LFTNGRETGKITSIFELISLIVRRDGAIGRFNHRDGQRVNKR